MTTSLDFGVAKEMALVEAKIRQSIVYEEPLLHDIASRVTIGRLCFPPASITYRAISWRRGSSDTMLCRIFASTRAISLATPKSKEVVIKAVPVGPIASAYITISGV